MATTCNSNNISRSNQLYDSNTTTDSKCQVIKENKTLKGNTYMASDEAELACGEKVKVDSGWGFFFITSLSLSVPFLLTRRPPMIHGGSRFIFVWNVIRDDKELCNARRKTRTLAGLLLPSGRTGREWRLGLLRNHGAGVEVSLQMFSDFLRTNGLPCCLYSYILLIEKHCLQSEIEENVQQKSIVCSG